MEEEFTVNLFSSASSDKYSNSLTKFTCEMAQPIYLDGSYSVALSQISLPPSFPPETSISSRDSIVYEEFKYTKLYTTDNFQDFIDVTLRIASSDVRFYDVNYFKDFLDNSIIYSPDSLAQTHSDISDSLPTSVKPTIYFNLNLDTLAAAGSEFTNSDFIPLVNQSAFTEYFNKSYVRLAPRTRYTLKQILYLCIEKILSKLRSEGLQLAKKGGDSTQQTPVEYPPNDFYSKVLGKYDKKETFGNFIQLTAQRSNTLIRLFIERFVKTVLTLRDQIMKERSLPPVRSEKFLLVYSDVVKEQFLADTKARVLGIFPFNSDKEFSMKLTQLDFNPVSKQVIHSISIALMDQDGNEINLRASTVPSFVSLKFRPS